MCNQAFAVLLKVQEFLDDRKLSAVFVPNGRWVKGPGAIVARVILAGMTPPGFCDDVRHRVHFEDAGSDPYRGVQLMEMSQETWAAIDEHERGAQSSGKDGWKQPGGDGCRSSPRGKAHVLGGLLEGVARAGAQTTIRKSNCPTREAKATEGGYQRVSGRGPSRDDAASGSSRPAARSGGVVRLITGTAGWTREQQQ